MLLKPLFRKTLSLVSYVALALVIAWLLMDRFSPTLKVGQDAPITESFTGLFGTNATFKSLLKKPMVINFWASWCGSCMKEMPTLSKISQKYAGELIFLGAAVQSSPTDILATKKRYFLSYQQVLVSDPVVEKWQAQALPTTYVLNKAGQILWSKAGVASENELEKAIGLAIGK